MTPAQIKLVQETWRILSPIQVEAAALFYNHLFEQYPELRERFTGDMTRQGRMLMRMLDSTVAGLEDLDSLLPPLRRLGESHIGYGVALEDYDKVGAALLRTLSDGLGDAFSPSVEEAWVTAYGVIASVMTQAYAETAA